MDLDRLLTTLLAAIVGLMITNAFVCLVVLEYVAF